MATDTYILANPTPAPIATGAPASLSLETALTLGDAVTELNLLLASGSCAIEIGDFIVLEDGADQQVFIATEAATIGDANTEVTVISQVANFSYPASGSTTVLVPGRGTGTAVAPGQLAVVTITETASPLEKFVSQGGIACPGVLTGNTAGTVVDMIDNLVQLLEKGGFIVSSMSRPLISAGTDEWAEKGL